MPWKKKDNDDKILVLDDKGVNRHLKVTQERHVKVTQLKYVKSAKTPAKGYRV